MNLLRVGIIARTHGYKGDLKISLDAGVEVAKSFKGPGFIYFAGKPVPFFLEHLQWVNHELWLKFEDVDSESEARPLCNKAFFLEQKFVKKMPLTPDWQQWMGYQILSQDLELIGQIVEIAQLEPLVLGVQHLKGKILLPVNSSTLLNVNDSNKEIQLFVPEGLINFYLGE